MTLGAAGSMLEIQSPPAGQMALGPNQQFFFPGTQLLGNNTTLAASNLLVTGNMTQPFELQQVAAFNTIQTGADSTQPL